MTSVELRIGDAFEGLETLETDSAHAAIVDYPWKFDDENGAGRFGRSDDESIPEMYDREDHEGLAFVLEELGRVLVPGGWVFVFGDDEVYPEFRDILQSSPFERRQTAYWDSNVMGMGYYHRVQTYPILTGTNGGTERYLTGRPNIYEAHHHGPSSAYQTEKPRELIQQILAPPVLDQGETVIEPFAGTFPSAGIALSRGCGAVGFEVNPEAYQIAQARFGSGITSEGIE